MVQKALFKQGKKPTVKATAGAGKSFKAKQLAKKTKLGARPSGACSRGMLVKRNERRREPTGVLEPPPCHPATARHSRRATRTDHHHADCGAGKRYVKAKGALLRDDRLDRAITASIVNNIESETSGAAAQKGSHLKVVVPGPGKALKKQKTRKKESLPAHRTQS